MEVFIVIIILLGAVAALFQLFANQSVASSNLERARENQRRAEENLRVARENLERAVARDQQVRQYFDGLTEVEGKTMGEVARVAGKPNLITAMDEGKFACKWQCQNYYITLRFSGQDDDAICEGMIEKYAG